MSDLRDEQEAGVDVGRLPRSPVLSGGSPPSAQIAEIDVAWSVGAVGERLGIAPSTLRTWERRYGVGPSQRTQGGHRRYGKSDIDRVELMRRYVESGVPAQDAARVALGLTREGVVAALATEVDAADSARQRLAPAVAIESVMEALQTLDAERVSKIWSRTLRDHPAADAWVNVFAPALDRIGMAWAAGDIGVEAEHLASDRLSNELHAHLRARRATRATNVPVLLASAEDDQHSMPVLAVEAALAEHGIGCHALGGRVPTVALAGAVKQVQPSVVFLWASLRRPRHDTVWTAFDDLHEPATVVLGGPGWPSELPESVGRHEVVRARDLHEVVEIVRRHASP